MRIESPAFKSNHFIPTKFTADGDDVSPPLVFKDIPTGTKSLVLIVEDPDAPQGVFDHWVVWNIPPSIRSFEEGKRMECTGINGFGESSYRGPAPPAGRSHRYFFYLFALNTTLDLKGEITKEEVLKAMKEHIITKAHMIGIYRRRVLDKKETPPKDWKISKLFPKK